MPVKKCKAVEKLKRERIQSFTFAKAQFPTVAKAVEWLLANGFDASECDPNETTWAFPQATDAEPGRFKAVDNGVQVFFKKALGTVSDTAGGNLVGMDEKCEHCKGEGCAHCGMTGKKALPASDERDDEEESITKAEGEDKDKDDREKEKVQEKGVSAVKEDEDEEELDPDDYAKENYGEYPEENSTESTADEAAEGAASEDAEQQATDEEEKDENEDKDKEEAEENEVENVPIGARTMAEHMRRFGEHLDLIGKDKAVNEPEVVVLLEKAEAALQKVCETLQKDAEKRYPDMDMEALKSEGLPNLEGGSADETATPDTANKAIKTKTVFKVKEMVVKMRMNRHCKDVVEAAADHLDDASTHPEVPKMMKAAHCYHAMALHKMMDSMGGPGVEDMDAEGAGEKALTAEDQALILQRLEQTNDRILRMTGRVS